MGKLFSKTYLALRQEILSGKLVVESDRGGGLRVTIITIADAIHFYDGRLGLAQVAAVGACENATAAQIEGLQDCLDRANLSDLVDSKTLAHSRLGREGPATQAARSLQSQYEQVDELENRLHIDQSFHRWLAESSGNLWLADLLDQIFSKMSLLRLTTTYQNPDVLEIWAEHERIVSAVEQRDSQAAAIAVRSHLVASKLRVVQALQGIKSDVSLQSIALF